MRCSKPTLRLLLHLLLPLGLIIIILVSLHVAVHSELLHLVLVLVTLPPLQDCVSLLFLTGTGGVIPILVVINVHNTRGTVTKRAKEDRLVIVLNSKLNLVSVSVSNNNILSNFVAQK